MHLNYFRVTFNQQHLTLINDMHSFFIEYYLYALIRGDKGAGLT